MNSRSKHALAILVGLFFPLGCSSNLNLNSRLTPDSHKETYESYFMLAKAAYDHSDLDNALLYSAKALKENPKSEEASILYGYVSLSLAGIDPFGLAKKLVSLQQSKKDSGQASLLDDTKKDTSDVLSSLKEVIGITPAEFQLLGTLDSSDPELPVLVPRCAEQARQLVKTLQLTSQAIVAACPFVENIVKVATDSRQTCKQNEAARNYVGKAHFLWAFAHLTEALAFNAALTYTTNDPTGGKTNLEQRVIKLKSTQVDDPTKLGAFVESVKSLEQTVSAILPISPTCSVEFPTTQLQAMLQDMVAVNLAFAQLPGVPKKITGAITAAMEKIQSAQSNANSVGGGSTSQSSTLKSQFTKKVSSALAEKINALQAERPDQITPEQKTQLCSSYDSISGGSQELAQVPSLCQTPAPETTTL